MEQNDGDIATVDYAVRPGMWTPTGDLVVRVDADTLWLADPQGAVRRENIADTEIDVHDLRTAAVLLHEMGVVNCTGDITLNRARLNSLNFWARIVDAAHRQAYGDCRASENPEERKTMAEVQEQLSPGLVLAIFASEAGKVATEAEADE